MAVVEDESALRAIYGAANPVAVAKELDHLDAHCRDFIALSPFLVLATSDGRRLDVSPKGDAPGVAQVADEKTLLIPDWPGNRRLDGLLNVLKHPQVGLIFLIPNVKETLRVNGAATIHDDEALRARFALRGRLPITVLKVAVEEAFIHCAKALMRSSLWAPETWPERSALASAGEIIRDHSGVAQRTETAEEMEKRYAPGLY